MGVATASLAFVSMYNFDNQDIENAPLFIFFSTVFAYHFIRIFENCECTTKAVIFYLRTQSLAVSVVGVGAFLGVLFYAYKIGLQHLWIVFPSTFIILWYAVPIFKHNGRKVTLRSYPMLKIGSIALVCSMITVLFPLQEQLNDWHVWLEFVQRFILVMVLIIPFDIRDIEVDDVRLKTIPQLKGIPKAKKIGVQLLLGFFVLTFLKTPIRAEIVFAELMIFIITLLLLVKTEQQQSKYYASFWVEAIPIFWLLLIWAFKYVSVMF